VKATQSFAGPTLREWLRAHANCFVHPVAGVRPYGVGKIDYWCLIKVRYLRVRENAVSDRPTLRLILGQRTRL